MYIWQGRETEIDTLDLAVARLAQKLDKTHLATRNKLKAEVYRAQSLNGLTPTKALRYLLTLFTRLYTT